MRHLLALTAVIFLVLSFQGCGDTPTLPEPPTGIPADIESFVENQNLPSLRNIDLVYKASSLLIFFKVEYGDLNDCPSGCFYSKALGLKLRKRIGWIRFDDYAHLVLGQFPYFDVGATDTALFDTSMWSDLEDASSWAHWEGLLPMLAADTDTPAPPLLQIARLLHAYVSGNIVWSLLDNPTVQEDRDILWVLANLPVLQGDPYELARQRAGHLLDEIGGPGSSGQSWVAIDPIQCLGNPWERDWLEKHDHDYYSYPRDMEDTYPIIVDYYKRLGVDIYDITTRWNEGAVCEACVCPVGYTLFLFIGDEDVPAMAELGYRLQSP